MTPILPGTPPANPKVSFHQIRLFFLFTFSSRKFDILSLVLQSQAKTRCLHKFHFPGEGRPLLLRVREDPPGGAAEREEMMNENGALLVVVVVEGARA